MALHLRREGVRIGRRRAGRLVRLMGLQAIYRATHTSDPHPEHLFCAVCGVKSFCVPRSAPDSYSVNALCLDPGNHHLGI